MLEIPHSSFQKPFLDICFMLLFQSLLSCFHYYRRGEPIELFKASIRATPYREHPKCIIASYQKKNKSNTIKNPRK